MTFLNKNLLPYLALAVGIIALGFSAIFVRWAAAPGPVMGFYRIGLATLLLTPFFVRRNRKAGKIPRAVLIFPVLGGLFTSLDHAIWNTSIHYTTAANATLLNNTAPLWVAFFALLVFRERLKTAFWIGLALTLSGAAIVLGSDFFRLPTLGWGDVLALVSGVFYAGYFLVTQRGRAHLDTLSYIWTVGLASTLTLLGMSVALHQPLSGYPPQTYLAFLGSAIVSQICGYLAVGYALGHLPASVVSPTMLGQPVMTAFLAFFLLGEGIQPVQALGGAIVLAGIYLVHRSRETAQSSQVRHSDQVRTPGEEEAIPSGKEHELARP